MFHPPRRAKAAGLLTGLLAVLVSVCFAQDSRFAAFNSDEYDAWASRLFQNGELAEYQSRMPQRLPSADSLPPLPWAYETDAGQFRHHISKLDGWVWLVASDNSCRQKSCPFMPTNLPLWTPFFDSLKAAGGLHVRYATTSYLRAQLLKWRRGLDQWGAPDPMLLISSEAHGWHTRKKLRSFMRQLGPVKRIPRNMDYHLLFDPSGRCVLLAADRYDHPLAKKPPKKTQALYPAEIQRRALLLMRQGG